MALVRTCDRCGSDEDTVKEYRLVEIQCPSGGFELRPDLCEHCKQQLIRFLNGSYYYDESEEDSVPTDGKKEKENEKVKRAIEFLSGFSSDS